MKKFNLTTLMKRLLALTMVASMFVFAGCGDDDDGGEPAPTQTLYEIMQDDSDLTQLEAYIDANATLKAALQGDAEYTLFAPTDAAFDLLKATLGVSDLNQVAPDVIASVLAFHVSAGAKTKAELAGGSFATLQGEDITINADGTVKDGGSVNSVAIVEADIKATNGIMQKVDRILIPPNLFAFIGAHLTKVSQSILLGASFTVLADGLTEADTYAAANSLPSLTDVLKGSTKITMFAPTNATFEAAAATAGVSLEDYLATITAESWYAIIANHIVVGDNNAGDTNEIIDEGELTTGAEFTTQFGGTITVFNNTAAIPADNGIGIYLDGNGDVDVADSGTYGNLDAEVVVLNAAGAPSNGTLHVIAGVLSPM